MTNTEQRQAAERFAQTWAGKGYEKGQSQPFWLSLLRDVYGVAHPEDWISFEEQVHLDHTSFIDGAIEATKVMIEQKSLGKDLNKPIRQSDGSLLTPFQQAKRYISELPLSAHPRWVVTCNFAEFYVYDMERPNGEPEKIRLTDLGKEYYRLQFLVDTGSDHLKREMEVSLGAGEIVGQLYNALLKQYKDPADPVTLRSLNILCVRLVFCLYAEDAGIFDRHGMFRDYLAGFSTPHLRGALLDLFEVLDTPPEQRDAYLEPALAAFPYVNGGLFRDESVVVPQLTDEIRELLLHKASDDFDWSQISPTIFGALFESTLNPETRRHGGMHYTSIENIHKVIDPLFLDALKAEFRACLADGVPRTRNRKLKKLQAKLGSLTFLDPACGSGNFLTETYLCLRRLENDILRELTAQIAFGTEEDSPVQVTIDQFFGIEINDFAVSVAKTALWIAESQMLKETEDIIRIDLDFLPLKTNASIVEGNALRLDWETVVPKEKLHYIMGNPPFVGFTYMDNSQKEDMAVLFKNVKNLDYVCAWYKIASDFTVDTSIETAFVSTNSITQGETVSRFWQFMQGDIINFAHQTFIWDSDASEKAHVYCVIIGFAKFSRNEKFLYNNGIATAADNINPYLFDGANVLVSSRNKPICNVPKMVYGNKPADGGNFIIEEDQYDDLVKNYPNILPMIKPLLGAAEYIKNKKRWCLWLVDISPKEIKGCPPVLERVKKCQEVRQSSIAAGIRKFAKTPTLFAQITQPANVDFIIVPRVSSERRRYIPAGFIKAGTIVTDSVQIIPEATLYHFGVLTSNVHMAWMRAVCGRLEMRYRYSKDVVYNNFPWPTPTEEQKAKIEATAQAILDARAKFPDCSLADLYDEASMPSELRRAHQENDRAVMQAYGFAHDIEESEIVAELMKRYQQLIERA